MILRCLNIGGLHRKKGWEVLNATAGPGVDHVGDCRDLSRFPDDHFDTLYASHVLEHIKLDSAVDTVKGWRRVLKPNGVLLVAVPDMEQLCRVYLANPGTKDRIVIARGFFGGHVDEFDMHMTGYDHMLLENVLRIGGFRDMTRVDSFGLFQDTSEVRMGGQRVSLNVRAVK